MSGPGEVCRVYEKTPLSQVTGVVIRPGGLALTDRAMAFCAFPAGARVVDVGCGTGATTEHLIGEYGLAAVGVDPSSVLLARGLERNPALPLVRGAGEELPFAAGELDGVLAECALSVMTDAGAALKEFARVLKEDGLLVLTDVYARRPEGAADLRDLPLSSCLCGALPKDELVAKLGENGFTVELWEDHSAVLKELAARLILAHGSLNDFWLGTLEGSGAGEAEARRIARSIAAARPGYYLLVARKPRVLAATESVCPECLRRVPAVRVSRGEEVFLDKNCPEHGDFRTVVWRGGPAADAWVRKKIPASPAVCYTGAGEGCPFDCGLCAEHRQHTCTALLEVTQRCNLRCSVCFADAGQEGADDPPAEVVAGWYRSVMAASGPCNIQLSGGEPTVRDDLPSLVRLGRETGFEFIQINTNGLRLAAEIGYVRALREAGLSSVFLQFDGTEDGIYERLRGRELLEIKKAAIANCAAHELGVVLVPTLVPGVNTHDVGAMIEFALDNMPAVRGVHFQPVSYFGRYPAVAAPERITLPEVMRLIEAQTGGAIRTAHFRPPGCEHELCSFNGSVIRMPDGRLQALAKEGGQCCPQPAPAAEGARNARRFVAHRWAAPQGAAKTAKPAGFGDWDGFLEYIRSHTLSISGMAFQDAWNLDLERLKGCCIHVVSREGRLIPFCAYNLTDSRGRALYRGRAAK